jgi:hypothetical protein
MAKPPYRVLIVLILGSQNEILMKIYRLETSKRRYNLKYYDMPNPFGALPPL